jgi:hypothetical protein
MQITITDEGTRTALECVMWSHMRQEAGEDEMQSSTFYNCAYDVARAYGSESTCYAENVLETLMAFREEIQQIRQAKLGTTVSLSTNPKALADGLESCRYAIEESDEFWKAPVDRREKMLETRDAVHRLMIEMPQPVEAVA